MKPFSSFQKLAQISGNCIKFPKERIKTSIAIEMFKTENHCKTLQVVDATDGTRHTRKRGLRTVNKMLSLKTLKRTLKRTLSLRTLKRILKRTLLLSTLKRTLSLRALQRTLSLRTPKRTLSLSTLKRTLSLRTLKGHNQTLTPPCRLQQMQQGSIGSMGRGRSRFRVQRFEGGPQISIFQKRNIQPESFMPIYY